MKNTKSNFTIWLECLNVPPGTSWRGDCYVCGGDNTLSVSNLLGHISYHCFRASCPVSGQISSKVDLSDLQTECRRLRLPEYANQLHEQDESFEIPDHFTSINGRPEVIEHLIKNHSYKAWVEGRADIRYDPKQNRVVFMCWDKDRKVCNGASGRALDKYSKPKWFIYGNPGVFLVLGKKMDNLILVEDCASACAVSSLFPSCALLGTNISDIFWENFTSYGMVFIALDKDATIKSIDLHRELSWFCKSVKVICLDKDLKYYDEEEISRMFNNGKIFVSSEG